MSTEQFLKLSDKWWEMETLSGSPCASFSKFMTATVLWREPAFGGCKLPQSYLRVLMGDSPHSGCTEREIYFLSWSDVLYSLTQVYSLIDCQIQGHILQLFQIPSHYFYFYCLLNLSTYHTILKRCRVGGRVETIPNITLNLHQVFLLTKTYLVFSRNFEFSVWHNLIVYINDCNFLTVVKILRKWRAFHLYHTKQ